MDNAMGTQQGQTKAASPSSKKDLRPTPDQMYLAAKLNGHILWSQPPTVRADTTKHEITPAALQKWNGEYGVVRTTDALRNAWGFPPLDGIENPYAYVAGILRGTS